jgi:hypothetical protein
MKKLTLELDEKELQMLQEITTHLTGSEEGNSAKDSVMSEAIRALILISYLNVIIPIKYGEDAVVTIEENK